MRKLLLILPLLAMGCGGIKNTNPLQGLAGPTDNSRFNFEATTMGWVPGIAPNPVDQLFQNPKISFFGSGSLGIHVTQFTNAASAEIDYAFSVANDLRGKTLTAWIYLPSAAAASDSLPDYAQIAGKDVFNNYANGYGPNLTRDGWTKLSWVPRANTTGAVLNDGQGYTAIGYDPSAVSSLAIKIGIAGAAASSFSYTGTIYVDAVDW